MPEVSSAAVDFVGSVAQSDSIDELCDRYLGGVEGFIDSYSAGIYVLDAETRAVENLDARGVSAFFLSRYEQAGRAHDPLLHRVIEEQRACDNAQIMSKEEWSASALYAEVLHLHRMTNLLEAPIVSGGTVVGTLNFGRQDEQGPFRAGDRSVAETLGRLLGIAITAVRGKYDLRRERDRALAALDLCSDAVVMTDVGAADRVANTAARAVLENLADGEAVLDELLERAGRAGGLTTQELEVALTGGRASTLRVRTASLESPSSVLWSVLELGDGADLAERAVFAQCHFTPRERDVAALAASGLRDKEIAEKLFLSSYTVKQYLKSCYRKLGVRSRVDLTRMITASPTAAVPFDSGDGAQGVPGSGASRSESAPAAGEAGSAGGVQ